MEVEHNLKIGTHMHTWTQHQAYQSREEIELRQTRNGVFTFCGGSRKASSYRLVTSATTFGVSSCVHAVHCCQLKVKNEKFLIKLYEKPAVCVWPDGQWNVNMGVTKLSALEISFTINVEMHRKSGIFKTTKFLGFWPPLNRKTNASPKFLFQSWLMCPARHLTDIEAQQLSWATQQVHE